MKMCAQDCTRFLPEILRTQSPWQLFVVSTQVSLQQKLSPLQQEFDQERSARQATSDNRAKQVH